MAMTNRKPKPDDRSDNVEKLQNMIQNTIENYREAEASVEFAGPEEREKIKAKNERRKKAIEGFRKEVKEEAAARENGEV
jgi:small acid-soluble spore protein (thioredoxin-like protein)